MLKRLYPWAVVVATLMLIFFGQGAMFVLNVQLKPVSLEMGWPREMVSLGYACAFFGSGIGALFFGHLSERIGMGRVALIGAACVPLGVFIGSYAEEPWHLASAYGLFVGLLGNACLFTPLVANVTRWFDRHRGIALGIATCGQSLGGTIWPPLITWLNATEGWRGTLRLYALACIVLMPILALVLLPKPPALQAGPPKRLGDTDGQVLGLDPRLVTGLLALAILCCCIPMSVPLVHLPAHGSDIGLVPQAAAGLLSVALMASFVSRILGGALADRIGGLRTLFIGSFIQCAMLAVIAFERDLRTLYAVCAIYGLGYGGIIAMYAYIVREYFPLAGSARRIAIVYFFGTTGMAIGGWLGGRLFDLTGGYQAAFLTAVGVNLVNLIVVGGLILRARGRRLHLAPA